MLGEKNPNQSKPYQQIDIHHSYSHQQPYSIAPSSLFTPENSLNFVPRIDMTRRQFALSKSLRDKIDGGQVGGNGLF